MPMIDVSFWGRKEGAIGLSGYQHTRVSVEDITNEEEVRLACYDAGYEHISSIRVEPTQAAKDIGEILDQEFIQQLETYAKTHTPNLPPIQNIPIRTEEGAKIRDAFKPKEGRRAMVMDYSQLETRLIWETMQKEEADK